MCETSEGADAGAGADVEELILLKLRNLNPSDAGDAFEFDASPGVLTRVIIARDSPPRLAPRQAITLVPLVQIKSDEE